MRETKEKIVLKGPVSYVHVKYKGRSYSFFGEIHDKVEDCNEYYKKLLRGEKFRILAFQDYFDDLALKNKDDTHLFLETMFVPNPTATEYKQLIAYNKNTSIKIKEKIPYGEMFDIGAWFWEQKQTKPHLFHPIDVRQATNEYKGALARMSSAIYFLEKVEDMEEYEKKIKELEQYEKKLDELLQFFIYGDGNFPNENYLKEEISKVRQTCFLQQEIDRFVETEWKQYKQEFTETIDIVFQFTSLVVDVYTLYAIFQPNYKNVVCYAGLAHATTWKRFFKYLGQPYTVDLNVLGCVDTTLKLKF